MSRIDLSTHDLFLRLGSTARTRSARADKLFRKLRSEEQQELAEALTKAPARVAPPQRKKRRTTPASD